MRPWRRSGRRAPTWLVAVAACALPRVAPAQSAEPAEPAAAGSNGGRARGPLLTVLGGATVIGGATLVAWEFVPRESRPPSWPRAGWGVVAAGVGLQSAGITLWRIDRDTASGGVIEGDRDLWAGGALLTGIGGATSLVGLVLGYLSLAQPTAPGEKGGSVYGTSLTMAGSALMSLGVPMLWLSRGTDSVEPVAIGVGPTAASLHLEF